MKTLKQWLKEKNISIKEFSSKIGCYRDVVKKVDCGKGIDKKIAIAIKIATKNEVVPLIKKVGRPRLMNKSTSLFNANNDNQEVKKNENP